MHNLFTNAYFSLSPSELRRDDSSSFAFYVLARVNLKFSLLTTQTELEEL